jgi:hypothetical protein
MKKILELVKKAEVEASKGTSDKRQTTRTTTPNIEDQEEENIENSICKGESGCCNGMYSG